MLKRGRSISGIELLPAELDFAAAAEIGPPVDLTDTVAPEPADESFGAWLAEATAPARLAVAQRQDARFAAAAAALLLLLLLLSAAEGAPRALFWLCAVLLLAAAAAFGLARARAEAAHTAHLPLSAADSGALRTPHPAVVV